MTNKKKNMLSAIRLWAWSKGMSDTSDEISSKGFVAEKAGLKTAFITELDKTKDELLDIVAKIQSDFIYIVIDDNAKRRELIKVIPDYCGILCYGNPFGLGFVYQVFKEPTQKIGVI